MLLLCIFRTKYRSKFALNCRQGGGSMCLNKEKKTFFLPVTLLFSGKINFNLWKFLYFATFFADFYALKVGSINQLAMLKLLYYYHSKVVLHYGKVALHYGKSCTFEIKNELFSAKVWSIQKKALPLHRLKLNIVWQSMICCLNRRLFCWLVSNNRYIPNTPCDGCNGLANHTIRF